MSQIHLYVNTLQQNNRINNYNKVNINPSYAVQILKGV
jgi:hypothetical protein